MSATPNTAETRVAVLVDCDNVSPDILEHALRMVAQFGRVVLRRGYGNQGTLAAQDPLGERHRGGLVGQSSGDWPWRSRRTATEK